MGDYFAQSEGCVTSLISSGTLLDSLGYKFLSLDSLWPLRRPAGFIEQRQVSLQLLCNHMHV